MSLDQGKVLEMDKGHLDHLSLRTCLWMDHLKSAEKGLMLFLCLPHPTANQVNGRE